MLIETNRVKKDFRDLVDRAKSIKVYHRGQEIGGRPTLYLAGDRDNAHVKYAERVGLNAYRRTRGANAMAAAMVAAGSGREYSRRNFLELGGLELAAAATAGAQDMDEIVHDPNNPDHNPLIGEMRKTSPNARFYVYKRKVPRTQDRTDIGDKIYYIGVWSDRDHKWKLAAPHRQLTYMEASAPNDPAHSIWMSSDKPTDGMEYLTTMNIDSSSVYLGQVGCKVSSVPRTFRWTQLPIQADINEGTNEGGVPPWLATVIRQALPMWNYKGLKFYQEVPKGSKSRLKLLFGDYPTGGGAVSSNQCVEPGTALVQINKNRYDLHEPWFVGVIVHELGHVLMLYAHAPWPALPLPNGDPNASKDIMTPVLKPNPATKPSLFNLDTVFALYGGEIPNGAELEYQLVPGAKEYYSLYVL